MAETGFAGYLVGKSRLEQIRMNIEFYEEIKGITDIWKQGKVYA